MIIYPQFNPVDSIISEESDYQKISNLINLDIKEIENNRLNVFDYEYFDHSSLGTPVTEAEIEKIYEQMLSVAVKLGYPNSTSQNIDSDKLWAAILHQNMGITRNEASKAGIWNALSCHYMPNLVAWRWPKDKQTTSTMPSERWVTLDKRRHAFSRLWWRAELLEDIENKENKYHLLDDLSESEIAEITERPTMLTAHNKLCLLIANFQAKHKLKREQFRETLKTIGLRLSIRDVDALQSVGEINKFVKSCFEDSQKIST